MSSKNQWPIIGMIGLAAGAALLLSGGRGSSPAPRQLPPGPPPEPPPRPPTPSPLSDWAWAKEVYEPYVPLDSGENLVGLLAVTLLSEKRYRPGAAVAFPANPTGDDIRYLLDNYQSIGFVTAPEHLQTLAELDPNTPYLPDGYRVIPVVIITDPDLALPPATRPGRAYQRRLIEAADQGKLTMKWKSAYPGQIASIPLVGQF